MAVSRGIVTNLPSDGFGTQPGIQHINLGQLIKEMVGRDVHELEVSEVTKDIWFRYSRIHVFTKRGWQAHSSGPDHLLQDALANALLQMCTRSILVLRTGRLLSLLGQAGTETFL